MSRRSINRFRGLLLAVWLCSLFFSAELRAQDPANLAESARADYGLENFDWNGLSQFAEIARAEGIELKLSAELDYDQLDPEQPLLMIHPQQPVAVANLSNFIVAGGRALLADDFGASDALLERLGITRMVMPPANLPHTDFVDDNPALPIFTPAGRHPLLHGVEQLVANHPAILFNVGLPVVSFSENGGLVYDMSLGEGKVIVLADPSLLINNMLLVADNAVFARNALLYLCGDISPCKVQVLIETWKESGKYSSSSGQSENLNELQKHIDAINDAIANFARNLPLTELLYYLSLLLTLGLATYLITIFPLRRPVAYSQFISRALDNVPAPQSELDWNLARFAQPQRRFFGRRSVNYALPLAILKEIFEELFFSRLGLWPISTKNPPSPAQMGIRFGAMFLNKHPEDERDRIENEVVALLEFFEKIPSRHRILLDSEAYFGERDLLKAYRRTQKILHLMGLKEEYERRTRNHA